MFRSGLVDTFKKGFSLASLSGARRGYMPPWLKTKYKGSKESKKKNLHTKFTFKVKFSLLQKPIVYPLQNFLLSMLTFEATSNYFLQTNL